MTMNMESLNARELLERAEELRRNCMFGEAINFYRAAAQAPDATDEIKRKSLASVELMQEINGFVNVDLMNPEDRCFFRIRIVHQDADTIPILRICWPRRRLSDRSEA